MVQLSFLIVSLGGSTDAHRPTRMQGIAQRCAQALRCGPVPGFLSRRAVSAGATTNRNPFDFTPDDTSLESAAFGTDELIRQQ